MPRLDEISLSYIFRVFNYRCFFSELDSYCVEEEDCKVAFSTCNKPQNSCTCPEGYNRSNNKCLAGLKNYL